MNKSSVMTPACGSPAMTSVDAPLNSYRYAQSGQDRKPILSKSTSVEHFH